MNAFITGLIIAAITAGALGLLFLIASFIIGTKVFTSTFLRPKTNKETAPSYINLKSGTSRDICRRVIRARAWLRTLPKEEVTLCSRDNINLTARLYLNPAYEGKTAVLVHGYKSCGEYDFSCGCPYYWNRGFNILIIDERGNRTSGGKYITFGVREREDVCDWCKYIANRYGDGHEIVLDGMSMGCTACLLAAAMPDFPKQVRAVVADCGFTSPYDEFRHALPNVLHLPFFPSYHVANLICRIRGRFSARDVNTLDAVKNIRVPVLFVHGDADRYVLPENTFKNYEACTAPKDLLIVHGASHGMSFVIDEKSYTESLDKLLNTALSQSA